MSIIELESLEALCKLLFDKDGILYKAGNTRRS
jgi:hypothetical protein